VQSYFPPERSKKILGRFDGLWANCIAALLGTVTPFCSCSSIPLFIGFTSAGLPVGVTFSFLISSPMVDLGSLVLLKVLPYREEQWRYLVYNGLTGKVERIDAIGQACVQLPEDHGIIFPGGYYLQSGEYKTFEQSMAGMRFKRAVRSPNGEDVQYIFYHPEEGRAVLLTYNMINRQLQNPLFGHGYARLEDGRTVIFAAEGEEPTRIHPMQIWQTPFCSAEFAARQPARSGFLGKIGNAELVRGVSDLYDLCREIDTPSVSVQRYGLLCQNTRRLFDTYHWLAGEPGQRSRRCFPGAVPVATRGVPEHL
jgi:hypothetical protein